MITTSTQSQQMLRLLLRLCWLHICCVWVTPFDCLIRSAGSILWSVSVQQRCWCCGRRPHTSGITQLSGPSGQANAYLWACSLTSAQRPMQGWRCCTNCAILLQTFELHQPVPKFKFWVKQPSLIAVRCLAFSPGLQALTISFSSGVWVLGGTLQLRHREIRDALHMFIILMHSHSMQTFKRGFRMVLSLWGQSWRKAALSDEWIHCIWSIQHVAHKFSYPLQSQVMIECR